MNKKSRLEFSQEELYALIKSIRSSSDPIISNIKERFKYSCLKNIQTRDMVSKIELVHFDFSAQSDATVTKSVVLAISILSGKDEGSIKPSDKIKDFHLTPTQLDKLRLHLNKLIKDNGGSGAISSSDIDGATTVQDLINLVLNKIP